MNVQMKRISDLMEMQAVKDQLHYRPIPKRKHKPLALRASVIDENDQKQSVCEVVQLELDPVVPDVIDNEGDVVMEFFDPDPLTAEEAIVNTLPDTLSAPTSVIMDSLGQQCNNKQTTDVDACALVNFSNLLRMQLYGSGSENDENRHLDPILLSNSTNFHR